jgi:hypothetical protein
MVDLLCRSRTACASDRKSILVERDKIRLPFIEQAQREE